MVPGHLGERLSVFCLPTVNVPFYLKGEIPLCIVLLKYSTLSTEVKKGQSLKTFGSGSQSCGCDLANQMLLFETLPPEEEWQGFIASAGVRGSIRYSPRRSSI